MKRIFDISENLDNEEHNSHNKKICLEKYWTSKKKDYICMVHNDDKYLCSIYDCCGIKTYNLSSANISQFI